MSEIVIVKEVDGPNSGGWYSIELEDGRKPSTKNEDLAKAAFQSRNSEVEAVISTQVKGSFTNLYLNEIDGVKDTPRRGRKPAGAVPASTVAPKRDDERIARQWAYGRSVELLVGSGAEFSFPLDPVTMSALSDQATALLNATKE